jgi:hypothetical protein|tara:strand:+ start:801 stop:2075 length:1275 start_codon:yes stop_codon:yes gene_type:complete
MSKKEDKELALKNAKNAVNNKKKSGTASVGDYGSVEDFSADWALNKPSLTERAVDSLKDPVGAVGSLKDKYEGGMSAAAEGVVGALKDPIGAAGALKDKFARGVSAAGDMVSGLMNSESDTPKSDTPALDRFYSRPDVKAEMNDPFSAANIKSTVSDPDFYVAPVSVPEESDTQPQPSNMRQDFFNQMKSLSGRGALTPKMYAQAREELGKYEGVSAEKFDSVMKKNRIRPSNFATAPKSSSPQEAAQNALFESEHGSALRAMAIRNNDPNYKFGSGSVLNQPARRVGPESGKLRNAARRLRRKGYTAQAGRMAEAAEIMRLGEPNIDTPELRRQRMSQKILAGREAQRQDKAYASSANTKIGQSGSGSGSRGEDVVTSYKPKPADTLIEEYNKQSQIPKRSYEQHLKELKAVAGGNLDMFGTT